MHSLRAALTFMLFAGITNASNAEATPVEVDAAVSRMSSATFKVEILAACGFSQSTKEKDAAINVAKIMALQKDGLSKKLSNDQFVAATLRTMDKALVESMQARAKSEATTEECAKAENKALWEYLIGFAKSMNQL